ncbi:cupin domain-containing protein [Sphingomonas floccifaciens]|uniref:Cupin domain-containing protein n=1 Tax=Sphingomonas floccifaciens TaxID=1844115 RepID=A0ABW4NHJ0_9SPHN
MNWTEEAMKARLVRYADLVPCRTAFIDTRTPGSTEKENFTIIGAGVSESADQHVHITERHGFNIGAARQPFGCVNSQHSHDTAEVFVVHSGHWRLPFGPNKEDGSIDIGPGDVASVPIHMFRGFEKLDEGVGFLWTVLGEDDPGKVTWAPAVFEAAAGHGLKLAKGGRLIDTSQGEYALQDVELAEATGTDVAGELKTPPMDKLRECVVAADAMEGNQNSPLAANGVAEAPVITPKLTGDGFVAGPIVGWWLHGFNLRRLTLTSGAYVPQHARREVEVIFVHAGTLEVSWEGGAIVMGAGDTLSVPIGLPRALRNTASVDLVAFVVRGGDAPAMPEFVDY